MYDEHSGLTPIVVLWLVGHLPEDSAMAAAMRGGPEFRVWTSSMYIQTAQANMLYAANRQRGGKTTRSPLIKPPVAVKKKPVVADLKAVKARISHSEKAEAFKRLQAERREART